MNGLQRHAGPARAHQARVELLLTLKAANYAFVTPTPATHRTVVQRSTMRRAADLRGVFGWSLPFDESLLPKEITVLLDAAGALQETAAGLRSMLRVASLGEDLFLHSAFPADQEDAVFFGPDTYRFAALLRQVLHDRPKAGVAVDVGAGAGAGAVTVARTTGAGRLLLTDVNPQALELARANCAAAEVDVELVEGDGLPATDDLFDLVIANPPYIAGSTGRTYSEGGGLHGAGLSRDWASEGARRLAPGGRVVLYTGSAIVAGEDALKAALATRAAGMGRRLTYRELDPDVFGEEMANPAYQDVDRIAAIGAVIERDR
jgi:methylase of polypeptide subunit release factors